MESKELDKIIAEFEDSVITNVEEHFAHYILEDYVDIVGSQPLYLIDDYDRYLYWINQANEIIELLEELIPTSSNDKAIVKLISLKVQVDKQLLKLADNDKDQIYFDLGLKKDPNQNLQPSEKIIRLNVDDTNLEKAIVAFHNVLRDNAMISNNLTDGFRSNFQESNLPKELIVWEQNMNQLVGLLRYLSDEKLIFGPRGIIIPRIISNHFHLVMKSEQNPDSIQRTISKTKINKTNPGDKFEFIIELADRLIAFK
jgi:hypothetical protein